jgi:hypothetical protein
MAPLTECRPVPGPLVYEYLRLAAPSRSRRDALTRTLAAYCGQHELLLGGVFTDEWLAIPVLSPGFAGLLEALTVDGSYGVVAPSAAHLGTGLAGRARLGKITETGQRLMLIRGARIQAVPR